jgi:hypothetical protein
LFFQGDLIGLVEGTGLAISMTPIEARRIASLLNEQKAPTCATAFSTAKTNRDI